MVKLSPPSLKALIVVGVFALVALQFLCQMVYVHYGWYSRWPLTWDQNRYSDYLYFYRLAFLKNGIYGLLEAYLTRPPYSLTLLVISLPTVLLGGTFYDLVLTLGALLFLLDSAIFLIVKRLSGSFSFAILSLLAIHFTTSGIISGSTLEGTAEAVRYQLNFLTALLPIVLLSIFIGGLTTASPRVWSLMLGLSVWCALVLRPPALPYFAVIVYPSLGLLWFLQWRRRQRALWYGVGTTVIATAGAAAHYYYIKDGALRYFTKTQNAHLLHPASGVEGLMYYIERGIDSSYLFLLFLSIVLVSFLLLLRRAYQTIRRHQFSGCKRLLFIYAPSIFTAYTYLLSYGIPASNPIKNHNLGDGFILLTVALALPCGFNLLKLPALRNFREKGNIRSGEAIPFLLLPIFFLLATCSLIVDWCVALQDVRHLEARDPHRLGKTAVQRVYLTSNEYIKNWIRREKRKNVSVLFLAQLHLSYESHSFQSLPLFVGIERAEVRVRQSIMGVEDILRPLTLQRPPAELIFVPRVSSSSNPKATYQLHEFFHLTEEHHKLLREGLPKVGYRKVDTIRISPEFELIVYRFHKAQHYQFGYGFP